MSISAPACWIVGSLNWRATHWTCFKPELLSHVREVDQIPYPMSGNRSCDSLLFIWQPAPAAFSMQPVGTAVYLKSITSAVLFHSAVSPGTHHVFIYFFSVWIHVFINTHSECHVRNLFEKKKKGFFNLSR